MAKRFFMLLYLFLTRSYENIEVVFIRHHTQAKEVDEDEFFYSRETGGTVVSSALELMQEIMRERYRPTSGTSTRRRPPTATTGTTTRRNAGRLLGKEILPLVPVLRLRRDHRRRAARTCGTSTKSSRPPRPLRDAAHRVGWDIYPVFRELFKKTMPRMKTAPPPHA
jgi:uncharacterized sporulation protein YeaH/YhbH (DUF444 family)